MARSFEVSVNPRVVLWARETRGFSLEAAAHKINVDPEKLRNIETGTELPTFTLIKQFVKLYKRPLAAFFLPEPPRETTLPNDFRSGQNASYSPQMLLAVRKVRRFQDVIKDLSDTSSVEVAPLPTASLSDDPEASAHKARLFFGISLETQRSHKAAEGRTYLMWREAIESKGIFVIQVSGIPIEEMRGFSANGSVKVIAVNSRDPASARNFTLFHEFAHLMLNATGICDFDADDQAASSRKQVEQFCNHVSAAFLVPRDVLESHSLIRNRYKSTWDDKTLKTIAREFGVSPEAILRRLTILQLSSVEFYKIKHSQWKEEYKRRRKPKVPISVAEKSVKERGKKFVSLVLENYQNHNINASDLAEYLGVRLKHVAAIEKLVGS